jgi:hypothetical protein
MSASAKFKLLIKAVWIGSMAVILAGCSMTPALRLGNPQAVQIKDGAGNVHEYKYVAIKSGNTILDHTMGFSIYDSDGKHVLTSITPNNGILESIGGPALQTFVPAATAFGLVK